MHYLIVIVIILYSYASALATDAGVSLSLGDPGFYGRIDIGNVPRPQLIYQTPVVIQAVPVGASPVYLHVPPGHEKHWSKHCRKYNACSVPVYFVQESWYNNVYVPTYNKGGAKQEQGKGQKKGYKK